MPPEINRGKRYSKAIDVWSFGCFAHELATGLPPFARRKGADLANAIMNRDVPDIEGSRWSADFLDFIKKCLQRDPDKRFTIDQLLYEHKFLAGIKVEKCRAVWMNDVTMYNHRKQQ